MNLHYVPVLQHVASLDHLPFESGVAPDSSKLEALGYVLVDGGGRLQNCASSLR